jgi:TolB-like protein/Tfp pilus assembly protein PilF
MRNANRKPIQIDLDRFKLHLNLKEGCEFSLHFDTPSRRFYLCVIALVVNEMKKLGRMTSIPLGEHWEVLALLNETVAAGVGSSSRDSLLSRIYRKWKDGLPDLENAPLFKVLGRRKEYGDGGGKAYLFTDEGKDAWANLFEYKGSFENVRLRFSVDRLGATLDDVEITYGEFTGLSDGVWERLVSDLRRVKDKEPQKKFVSAAAVSDVGRSEELSLTDKLSIAVLPFVNISGDPHQEYFCDGITEEIITGLTKVPHLFVIARNSTFTYKGKPVKIQKVGQELGVRYVLEGSTRKAGEQVRISAQLIDAKTGHHLWAERYNRKLEDIFELQDEITLKVITELQVKLTDGEYARTFVKGTKNLEAYLKFLEGRRHFYQLNKDSNFLAQQTAKEIVSLDPKFPRAYMLLGWTHLMDVLFGASNSPKESLAQAEGLALKALELDDTLARPHALLGYMYMMKKEWDKALAEGEHAVSMDPNSENFYVLAHILTRAGKPEESIALHKKGMRLDPITPPGNIGTLGLAYLMAGRYEEAILACKKAIHSEPDLLAVHNYLAASYSLAGREEEARSEAAEVLRIDPKFSVERFVMARPFKNQADTDLFINALRKAGLPG